MKNDDMGQAPDPKTIAKWLALGLLALLAVTWIAQGNDFFLLRVFAPRTEQVRRETFEQSKAYVEGKAQELRRMQSEYIRATPDQKAALAAVIAHQFADTDESKLPPDVADFLRQVRVAQSKAVR